MFRRLSMALALFMIALPIGGGAHVATASVGVPTIRVRWDQCWLLQPSQLAVACACLVVLALAASLRWSGEDNGEL